MQYKETILREINKIINYISEKFYIRVNELELKFFIKSNEIIDYIIDDVLNDPQNQLIPYIKPKIKDYNIKLPVHKLSYELYHKDVGLFYFLFFSILSKHFNFVKQVGKIDYFDDKILGYMDERVEIFRPHFFVDEGGLLMKYIMRAVQGSLVVSAPMKIHLKILEEVLKIIDKEYLINKPSTDTAYYIAKANFPLSILFLIHLAYSSEIMTSKRGLV